MAQPTESSRGTIALFDVDGTLAKSRQPLSSEMNTLLADLRQKGIKVGLVSGSDISKITEQATINAEDDLLAKFDYIFAENGLVAYHGSEQISCQSILKKIGETNLQRVINFSLRYMSDIELPVKRGNFIEFRTGMVNICPVGRSCTLAERLEFFAYDQQHGIREKMAKALREQFSEELGLEFAIGGQISIDCYPTGWDKRFCLQFLEKDFDTIYFFGDRTQIGGNDHAIYIDDRTIGHSVESPEHTLRLLRELFF